MWERKGKKNIDIWYADVELSKFQLPEKFSRPSLRFTRYMVTNISIPVSPPISLSFAHAHYAHACGATRIIRLARRERIDFTPLRAFKARELRTHFAPIITAMESVVCEFYWLTRRFLAITTSLCINLSLAITFFSCNSALY